MDGEIAIPGAEREQPEAVGMRSVPPFLVVGTDPWASVVVPGCCSPFGSFTASALHHSYVTCIFFEVHKWVLDGDRGTIQEERAKLKERTAAYEKDWE